MDVLFVLEKSSPDRFEPSNADVRWTSARCGLDRIDTMISLFAEKRNATNLAGTVPMEDILIIHQQTRTFIV